MLVLVADIFEGYPTTLARPGTIDMLPNDTLLTIFGFYQMSSPLRWYRLAHVCQKWRSIIFEPSSRKPDLRIYRTPIPRPRWLALPIFVKRERDPTLHPFTPEDEDNFVAALEHPDRVNSIHLTATTLLLEEISLSTIEKRVSELRCAKEGMDAETKTLAELQLTLPSTFRPNIEYPSPVAFAGVLYGMTQLRSLSLYLRSPISRHEITDTSPLSVDRVVLPALTHFTFRGSSDFLDRFVTIIDSPLLVDIEITFEQPVFQVSTPNLREFVNRTEVQKSYSRADIISSERAVSISFTQPGVPMRLKFEVFSFRNIFISQICDQFLTFLVTVEDLHLDVMQTTWDYETLLRIIHRFKGAKWFRVACGHSTDIVRILELLYQRNNVLPALYKLCIREPEPHYAPLREAVASFVQSRWLSGHLIGVEYERPWTDELVRTGDD
ncbi:hypothetical protein EDB87DRAFT_1638211 [Lactarius vividus]|nr:hypothetical protein EDB87DRAFT_1638211 [Lactarius vividus]